MQAAPAPSPQEGGPLLSVQELRDALSSCLLPKLGLQALKSVASSNRSLRALVHEAQPSVWLQAGRQVLSEKVLQETEFTSLRAR